MVLSNVQSLRMIIKVNGANKVNNQKGKRVTFSSANSCCLRFVMNDDVVVVV